MANQNTGCTAIDLVPAAGKQKGRCVHFDQKSIYPKLAALASRHQSFAKLKHRCKNLTRSQQQLKEASQRRTMEILDILTSIKAANHEPQLRTLMAELELDVEKATSATCVAMELAGSYIELLCTDFQDFHSEMQAQHLHCQSFVADLVKNCPHVERHKSQQVPSHNEPNSELQNLGPLHAEAKHQFDGHLEVSNGFASPKRLEDSSVDNADLSTKFQEKIDSRTDCVAFPIDVLSCSRQFVEKPDSHHVEDCTKCSAALSDIIFKVQGNLSAAFWAEMAGMGEWIRSIQTQHDKRLDELQALVEEQHSKRDLYASDQEKQMKCREPRLHTQLESQDGLNSDMLFDALNRRLMAAESACKEAVSDAAELRLSMEEEIEKYASHADEVVLKLERLGAQIRDNTLAKSIGTDSAGSIKEILNVAIPMVRKELSEEIQKDIGGFDRHIKAIEKRCDSSIDQLHAMMHKHLLILKGKELQQCSDQMEHQMQQKRPPNSTQPDLSARQVVSTPVTPKRILIVPPEAASQHNDLRTVTVAPSDCMPSSLADAYMPNVAFTPDPGGTRPELKDKTTSLTAVIQRSLDRVDPDKMNKAACSHNLTSGDAHGAMIPPQVQICRDALHYRRWSLPVRHQSPPMQYRDNVSIESSCGRLQDVGNLTPHRSTIKETSHHAQHLVRRESPTRSDAPQVQQCYHGPVGPPVAVAGPYQTQMPPSVLHVNLAAGPRQ